MIVYLRQKTLQGLTNCAAITTALCLLSIAVTPRTALAEDAEIHFWHWWNSAGEVKNIATLNKYLKQKNLTWTEQAAQSSSSHLYLAQLKDRLDAQRPDAAMLDSSETHNYAKALPLLALDDIAQEQEWAEVIPLAIQERAKHQGHWVSAPLNSHSTNWLWINKTLFTLLDMPEPETWDDLIDLLAHASALGIPALATPREDWEQALLFELVVISTGGLEFYRRLFVEQQRSAADQQILAQSFLRLQQLAGYFAPNTHSLSWDQATEQLWQGQVLMQVHGSWVNSELSALGAEAQLDYLCLRFPGTQGAYVFNSDHVVFFPAPPERKANQQQLARIFLDKEFQRELSIASGAAPARVDINTDGFNHCSQKSINDLRMANMRRAVMPSIINKNLEVIVGDFLNQRISADSAAENVLSNLIQTPVFDTVHSQ